MKKAYQIFRHIYNKYKVELYMEQYFKTEQEAIDQAGRYTDDEEVLFILPVYLTEKRYKWVFDEM